MIVTLSAPPLSLLSFLLSLAQKCACVIFCLYVCDCVQAAACVGCLPCAKLLQRIIKIDDTCLSFFLSATSSTKRKIINAVSVLEGLCTVQIATRLCCHLKPLANSRVTRELCTDRVPAAALLVVTRIQCLVSYQ